jgi:murein DD-endopeptidase MepM/ murein hydrolase activator NlpD
MYVFPITMLRDGRFGVIVNGYDSTPDPDGTNKWGGGIVHPGVDILYFRREGEPAKAPEGTKKWYFPSGTVRACAVDAGVVTLAYLGRTGGVVRIDHGGGIISDYIHMDTVEVARGDTVIAGQDLGLIGKNPAEGKVGLNHLHFQMWKGGELRNPSKWIRRAEHLAQPRTRYSAVGRVVIGALIGPLAALRPTLTPSIVIDLGAEEAAGYPTAR